MLLTNENIKIIPWPNWQGTQYTTKVMHTILLGFVLVKPFFIFIFYTHIKHGSFIGSHMIVTMQMPVKFPRRAWVEIICAKHNKYIYIACMHVSWVIPHFLPEQKTLKYEGPLICWSTGSGCLFLRLHLFQMQFGKTCLRQKLFVNKSLWQCTEILKTGHDWVGAQFN